jgi:hypothetical protein
MKINWKAVREFFIPPTLFESEGYWHMAEWFRAKARNQTDYDYSRLSWWDDRFPIVMVEERDHRYNVWTHLKGEGWSLTHNAAHYGTAWKLKGDRRRMEEETMQMMFSI